MLLTVDLMSFNLFHRPEASEDYRVIMSLAADSRQYNEISNKISPEVGCFRVGTANN